VSLSISSLTVRVALAAALVPADELRSLVVLTNTPPIADCTLTETLQVDVGPTELPDILMTDEPATAVIVPPKQLLIKAGDGDTTKPAGIVSMNLMFVAALGDAELSMVNLNTLIWSVSTVAGVKLLVKEGEVAAIVNISVAGPEAVSEISVIWLLVLLKDPGAADDGTSRSTLKEQLPPAARFPPMRLNEEVPEIVEPAPHTSLSGKPVAVKPEMTTSKSSLNDKRLNGAESLLVMVNWSVVLPPAWTEAMAKALLKATSKLTTVRTSEAGCPLTPVIPTKPDTELVVFV
jgi:hypothetical protein